MWGSGVVVALYRLHRHDLALEGSVLPTARVRLRALDAPCVATRHFAFGFMRVTLYTCPARSYVVHSPTCSPASKVPERMRVPSTRNHSQKPTGTPSSF